MNKICSKCKKDLPIEMFTVHRKTKDGLYSQCKECKRLSDKKYCNNNKHKLKLKSHQYYLKNKEVITDKIKVYIKNNLDKHRAWGTKAKNKLKYEVFSHYCQSQSPKCYCGESDLSLLTIDHIKGKGNKHRKKLGMNGGGYNFYRWLIKNDYPEGFQVLCFNHQFKKKHQECRVKDPTKIQKRLKNNHMSLKKTCFSHYGSSCPCGEKDIDILTLDHVNDNGAEHRNKLGEIGRGGNFYYYLRYNNFPNDPPLQVLCMNCQINKRNKWYEKRKRKSG